MSMNYLVFFWIAAQAMQRLNSFPICMHSLFMSWYGATLAAGVNKWIRVLDKLPRMPAVAQCHMLPIASIYNLLYM